MLLDASTLPPFEPNKKVVQCANGPMTALTWAFCCNVPPLLRISFMMTDDRGARSSELASPALLWNYSVFHLAHHYETIKQTRFVLQDNKETASVLLEVTALKACPDSKGRMKELSRDQYIDPQDQGTKLGPVPLFFLRYLILGRGNQESMYTFKTDLRLCHVSTANGN